MTEVDVAVVGLGLAGSATVWAVSGRGRSVAAFEAFEPGHRRGSSHGHSRIFRRAYLDPFYVDLTGRADRLWRRLQDAADERLLVRTGGVDRGEADQPTRMAEVLAAADVPAEMVEPGEAAGRWPGIRFESPVLFHPDAGVLDPERAIDAMTRLARATGAVLTYEAPVTALEPDGESVLVRTASESLRARTVVVAAGAWTQPLLSGLVELPALTVTQENAFFFQPYESTAWPTFIHDDPIIYGMPEGPLVKVAEHHRGRGTTADDRDGLVDPAARERVKSYVREWLPGLDPVPRDELTCLYTTTKNQDFVIDRCGPIVVCSACSGHGAKFAPLIGELAADLVDGGAPLTRFALTS
jgi:monomeric sarcosine oxidase